MYKNTWMSERDEFRKAGYHGVSASCQEVEIGEKFTSLVYHSWNEGSNTVPMWPKRDPEWRHKLKKKEETIIHECKITLSKKY